MSRAKFCVAIWCVTYCSPCSLAFTDYSPCPNSGGGIGGLCLAVALSRYQGIQVDLYEAAAQFREIGAGVSIWARSWDILTALGLQAKLVDLAHGSPDMSASGEQSKQPNALQLTNITSQEFNTGSQTSLRRANASIRLNHHVSTLCLCLRCTAEAEII